MRRRERLYASSRDPPSLDHASGYQDCSPTAHQSPRDETIKRPNTDIRAHRLRSRQQQYNPQLLLGFRDRPHVSAPNSAAWEAGIVAGLGPVRLQDGRNPVILTVTLPIRPVAGHPRQVTLAGWLARETAADTCWPEDAG